MKVMVEGGRNAAPSADLSVVAHDIVYTVPRANKSDGQKVTESFPFPKANEPATAGTIRKTCWAESAANVSANDTLIEYHTGTRTDPPAGEDEEILKGIVVNEETKSLAKGIPALFCAPAGT